MSDMPRDEAIHWASDVILKLIREDEFLKTQNPDIVAHAIADTLFRFVWFRCSDEEARRKFLAGITDWLMSSLDTYKPDWSTVKKNA